jgi:hypothetical protein
MWRALDPDCAIGELGALAHRREPEMARHRRRLVRAKANAVVGDPNKKATVTVSQQNPRLSGTCVLTDIRESFLRHAVENDSRLVLGLCA